VTEAAPAKRRPGRRGGGAKLAKPNQRWVELPEYSPALEAAIVEYVVAVGDLDTAAVGSGVPKSTLLAWMRRGGRGEEPFAAFARHVLEAQAKYQLRKALSVEAMARDKDENGNPSKIPASVRFQALTWQRPRLEPSASTPRDPGATTGAWAGRAVGRPSRIHDLVPLGPDGEKIPITEAIANAVRLGVPMKHAADLCALAPAAMKEWIARGAEDQAEGSDTPFADFASLIAQARGEFMARNVRNVAEAGSEDWRASAFLLERRFPNEFAERQQLEVGVELRKELPEDAVRRAILHAADRFRDAAAIDVEGVPVNRSNGSGNGRHG